MEGALGDYNQALDSQRDTDILFDRSLVFLKKKNFKAALADLDEIIRLERYNDKALHQRGYIYRLTHRYHDALRDLSVAIQMNSSSPNAAYFDRGLVYKNLGQLPNALQDLSAAIRVKPDDESAYHERGRVLLAMKNFRAALADFTKATELDPSCAEAVSDRDKVQKLMNAAVSHGL